MVTEILHDKTLWSGIVAAGAGGLWAAVTAEGLSGTLVAFGGLAVVAYGLWSAGREKVIQDAFRRERLAVQRLDEALTELETIRVEHVRLSARVAYCEANHDPTTPTG